MMRCILLINTVPQGAAYTAGDMGLWHGGCLHQLALGYTNEMWPLSSPSSRPTLLQVLQYTPMNGQRTAVCQLLRALLDIAQLITHWTLSIRLQEHIRRILRVIGIGQKVSLSVWRGAILTSFLDEFKSREWYRHTALSNIISDIACQYPT